MRPAPSLILLLLILLAPAPLRAAEPVAQRFEFDESGRRIVEPAPAGTLAAALQELFAKLEERLFELEGALGEASTHELRETLRARIVQEKDAAHLEALEIRLDFARREGKAELVEAIQAELAARQSPPDLVDPEARRLSAARTDEPADETADTEGSR